MTVIVESHGSVWTVVLSRPEKRNAVDPETARELHRAFVDFDQDESALVAVLWGDGGAFCSGWDLHVAGELAGEEALDWMEFPTSPTRYPIGPMGPTRLELTKPVIAAIAGPAVAGGMELALWCDVRVMEKSAYMGVYSRRWGVPLVDGGTVRLPRLVGEGRAMDMILTGRQIGADECLRVGLAEYVVEDSTGRAKAEDLAAEIARFPQGSLRSDRLSVRSQAGRSEAEAMEQEWSIGRASILEEGVSGARRFAAGAGRHGAPSEDSDA